jgi:hypothetical protein
MEDAFGKFVGSTMPGFSRIGADRSGYSCIRRLTASSSAEGILCGDEILQHSA